MYVWLIYAGTHLHYSIHTDAAAERSPRRVVLCGAVAVCRCGCCTAVLDYKHILVHRVIFLKGLKSYIIHGIYIYNNLRRYDSAHMIQSNVSVCTISISFTFSRHLIKVYSFCASARLLSLGYSEQCSRVQRVESSMLNHSITHIRRLRGQSKGSRVAKYFDTV